MTTSGFEDGAAYIEGEYVPIGAARIPILDAGFLRSDVTYDVAHVWKGRFFRLDDHIERFRKSYEALRMRMPLSIDEIRDVAVECVRLSGLRDAYVEVIASRGLPRDRSRDPADFRNAFYAFAVPFIWISPLDQQKVGMNAIISSVRRIPPESFDPTIKNFHWGDLVRGVYEAKDRGAKTAILVDEDDNVTEGPGYNVFAVRRGELFTPARGVLEGVTRRTILELAKDSGIDANVGPLSASDVRDADEIFATSTAGGVMPITTLDGATVGNGKPGPLTTRLKALYWAAHDDDEYSTPIEY